MDSQTVTVDRNGVAEATFFISPAYIIKANKYGDGNTDKQHEYYVLAEYENQQKASRNTNVDNPTHKPPVKTIPEIATEKVQNFLKEKLNVLRDILHDLRLLQPKNKAVAEVGEPEKTRAIDLSPNVKLTNGDFIAVVNASKGAMGFGHNALMIGNDKSGWTFVSKEGRREDASSNSNNNASSGGPALDPKVALFSTMADFLTNPKFSEYNHAAVFSLPHSDVSQTKTRMVIEAASKYSLLNNNCGHACGATLESVGLDPGWIKSGPIRDRWGHVSESWLMNPSPNVQYEKIIENNSKRLVTILKK